MATNLPTALALHPLGPWTRFAAKAGAWTFIAWATATTVLVPTIRLVAEAHGFIVARLLVADVALVVYALVTGGLVLARARRGQHGRWMALLAVPPLAIQALDRGLVRPFTLDRSGYPFDLIVLSWLDNLALVALVASLVLFLLAPWPRAVDTAV